MTSAAARAYGARHKARRRALLAQLAGLGAAPCPRCGKLMVPGMNLHLGHTFAEDKLAGLPGDRLEHARCNLSAGGKVGIRFAQAALAARRQVADRTAGRGSRDW
jgi:hypothetical protein